MSSFDRVYRGILKMLYEGRLLPGQRLIAPSLANEFQASRNTVREVLNRLCATGVLSVVRNQSPTVRRLSRREMEDLLDVVSALLSLAARSAAKKITDDARRRNLEEAYRDICSSETGADLVQFVHARERYYRALLRVSGNYELIRLFPSVHVHIMRLQLRSIPLVAQSAQYADYEAIHRETLNREPNAAAKAAEAHVAHMMDAIRNLPDNMFAPELEEDPQAAESSWME